MEEARRLELDQQLDDAIASGDGARIKAVRRTMEREMLECTAHTASRIKEIREEVGALTVKVDTLCDEWSAVKNRIEGGRVLWSVLKTLTALGGGAALMKLLG